MITGKLKLRTDFLQDPEQAHAMRHRLSVGTIVSDAMMKVRADRRRIYRRDRRMVHLQAQPGRCFTPAGRNPEFVMIKDMSVMVRKAVGQIDRAQLDGRRMPSAPTWVRLPEKAG